MVALSSPQPARPGLLIVTADESLRGASVRLAAAAGVPVVVATDIGAGFQGWPAAGVVLVGADLAVALATLAPERRDRVWVLTARDPDVGVLRAALRLGADHVLELPGAEPALTALLGDLGEAGDRHGLVLGVLGGSGGVGATTLACALGQVAPDPAVVVEVDPLGPGLDRMLGMEEAAGVRWSDLVSSRGRLNSRSLREALPRREGLGALTFGDAPHAPDPTLTREVVAALRRGHGSVVIDLPRPDGGLWTEIAPRCEAVVVVVDGSVGGVASAGRVIARLPDPARVSAVVRRGAGDPVLVAAALGVPVVAELVPSRRVTESIDLGYGPVRSARDRIARLARTVWAEVAER